MEFFTGENSPAGKLSLNDRERSVLRCVVHNYILTANPVGSRALSKKYQLGWSPATIRNVLADLEDMGLLTHTHTSAGRIPTDLGYRIYVNHLMNVEDLTEEIRNELQMRIAPLSTEVSDLMNQVGALLSEVSRLLGVITAPDVSAGILEKIEMIRLSAEKVMVLVIVKSGFVQTINLEIRKKIEDFEIVEVNSFINQRLAGLRLSEIPKVIRERLQGSRYIKNTLVRLFLKFPEKIFTAANTKPVPRIDGAKHVLELPEYQNPDKFKGIIELIEDRDVIVHLFSDIKPGVNITIGEENKDEQLKDMSVITSQYRIGDHTGTLGIIGPTRMNYSKLVTLVDYTSRIVSERIEAKK